MSDQNQKNPLDLITRDIVETALMKDLGPKWNLTKFEIKDFTKKGDNYSCKVTSVCCTAIFNGKEKSVTYIAKLNPHYSMSTFENVLLDFFVKECEFYCNVGLTLNKVLTNIDYSIIHFPQYLYYNLEKGAQVLLTRDLRQEKFIMFNRKLGMDYDHASLVMKELAKLHAASMILKAKLGEKTLLQEYPFLTDEWLSADTSSLEMFKNVLTANLETSIKLLKQVKGYEQHIRWIENLKPVVIDTYCDAISSGSDDMKVICHGDCWNNNVLFSYDDCGKPNALYFVDLQLCRYGSIGLDLVYFLSLSLTGKVRNAHQDQLISIYYKEFKNILEAANQPMKLTEERFREEIRSKIIFGIVNGLSLLPLIICESEDAPDFSTLTDTDSNSISTAFSDVFEKTAKKNPLFQERFLAIVDDIKRFGFLKD